MCATGSRGVLWLIDKAGFASGAAQLLCLWPMSFHSQSRDVFLPCSNGLLVPPRQANSSPQIKSPWKKPMMDGPRGQHLSLLAGW